MNWHPSVCGPIAQLNAGMECICVVSPLKDPDGLSLRLFSLIQCVWPWAGSPSRFLGICLIWSFCLHPSLAFGLKGAALPLFASLLGSEENDNNEAWRLSSASHTFTLIKQGTQTMLRMQTHTHTAAAHTHTDTLIFTHTCNVKWMQVAISFCLCHTKCANICLFFICNLLQSLH